MLRATILALTAATVLGATAVQAQTFQIGPDGPAVDLRNQRQRDRDAAREDAAREREFDRRQRDRAERRADRDIERGERGRCRTITTRERDEYGRSITRETRECR